MNDGNESDSSAADVDERDRLDNVESRLEERGFGLLISFVGASFSFTIASSSSSSSLVRSTLSGLSPRLLLVDLS